ncbi:MAG: hypothetical protein AAFW73_12545 [Bacteroidota bacterium]
MRLTTFLSLFVLAPYFAFSQFIPTDDGLTIIITDGTEAGRKSVLAPPSDQTFQAPIRTLGMADAIQAGAFLIRPEYGLPGFFLIFCVNDSISDTQGSIEINGQTYRGVYRLIRQKAYLDEEIPEGMQAYRITGTIFLLGVS